MTLAEATALAKQHFGSWTGGAAAPSRFRPPPRLPRNRVYLVDRPDAAQTVVAQWLSAPERKSADYDALTLADAVWGGGGFGTRLNLNLREDKGYSYGVFSDLALMSHAGLWSASGGVQTNKTKESLVEFDREMKAMAGAKPISEAEFASARERRLRATRSSSNRSDAQRAGRGQLDPGVAADGTAAGVRRHHHGHARAGAGGGEEVRQPEAATLLLVGDRSKIEAGVRELQLGEIVVLDTEGKPVTATGTEVVTGYEFRRYELAGIRASRYGRAEGCRRRILL